MRRSATSCAPWAATLGCGACALRGPTELGKAAVQDVCERFLALDSNDVQCAAVASISTGLYRFPVPRAADIALSAIRDLIRLRPRWNARVAFVCIDDDATSSSSALTAKLFKLFTRRDSPTRAWWKHSRWPSQGLDRSLEAGASCSAAGRGSRIVSKRVVVVVMNASDPLGCVDLVHLSRANDTPHRRISRRRRFCLPRDCASVCALGSDALSCPEVVAGDVSSALVCWWRRLDPPEENPVRLGRLKLLLTEMTSFDGLLTGGRCPDGSVGETGSLELGGEAAGVCRVAGELVDTLGVSPALFSVPGVDA
ncbi:hypothetical protein GQ600_21879 [Phytophthora cactorum]|nr:hypothetical protein GQ600_21879 [Phytophthora cactorum]